MKNTFMLQNLYHIPSFSEKCSDGEEKHFCVIEDLDHVQSIQKI